MKTIDLTDEEALADVVLHLANEICDGEDQSRQQRIRKLLIEFADEIKIARHPLRKGSR